MEPSIAPQPFRPAGTPGPKWFSHPLIVGAVATIVIAAAAVGVYWSLQKQAPNPASTNVITDIQIPPPAPIQDNPAPPAPQSESNLQQATQAAAKTPSEWGTIQKVALLKEEVPTVFQIDYSTGVKIVYQVGVNKIYWLKKTKTDSCEKLKIEFKLGGPNADYSEGANCGLYAQGFYDLASKTQVTIKDQDYPILWQDGWGEVNAFYSLFTSAKTQMVFSPKGTYFAMDGRAYEGCALVLVNTKDGSIVTTSGNKSVNHYDTLASYSCSPVITFSDDEKTIAIQSDYAGMASPGSEFTVINGSTSFAILPMLLTKKIEVADGMEEDADPVKNIAVTALDNAAIQFKISSTTKYLKAGSYEFNFATKKLTSK